MLPSRSHSRAEAPLPPPPLRERGDSNPSPVTPASSSASVGNNAPATIQIPTPVASTVRASPQKSQIRTYDSKLISREMDRLVPAMHTPPPAMHSHSVPSHVHSLTPAGSTSTLTLVPTISHAASSSMSGSSSNPPISFDNPWSTLHVLVLPLFNGEALRLPLEDLNALVKKHLNAVVSRSPSRAVSTLEGDVVELLATGMITLNAKLTGIDDDKLVARVVDLFGFFWDQILPYVEGVFLPLQMDPLLLSLHRKPAPSDSPQGHVTLASSAIDVRTIALKSFRDCIILGLADRMHALLLSPSLKDPTNRPARLQQMLLVLMSIQSHSDSLTTPTPLPSPGEHAIISLLRTARNPHSSTFNPLNPYPNGRHRPRSMAPPSFSGGAPRDRRGRIARKEDANMLEEMSQEGSYTGGYGLGLGGTEDETSTLSGGMLDDAVHRYRSEKEFLDSLKSPIVEPEDGVFNVAYEYDSDEHSDDASDLGNEIQRTGLSMSDWDHR